MEQEPQIDSPIINKPELNTENSFEFEENNLRGEWQTIESEGTKVEGALYKSPNPNGELIIFVPGVPGDAVSWFEEKDVPMLLEQGYDVFTTRHGGVHSGQENKNVYHNQQRFEKGTNLGNEEMSVNNWVKEPEILMEYFSDRPITFITHSFGGLALGHSIVELQKKHENDENNPVNRIKRWVNLSGVNYNTETYHDKYESLWRWYFENILAKSCNIKNIEKELADLGSAVEISSGGLPSIESVKNIRLVSVNPPEDELVGEDAGLQLQEQVGHGVVLRDRTVKKEDLGDKYIHDYPHLEPDVLSRLLKMKTSDSKHIVTLGRDKNISPFTKE